MTARLATVTALVALALPASASAQSVPDANCPPPRDTQLFGAMNGRTVQTFTAQASGALRTAQLGITKGVGTSGDYVIQIVELGPGGVPTNTVLASTTVLNASVPTGDATIAGSFDSPATVTAGQSYGLLITRPGPNTAIIDLRTGDDCPGAVFGSVNQTNPFVASPADWDLVFAVFVEPPPPEPVDATAPQTVITGGPKDRTKKKQATFEFSGTDARAVAGFECSLDGAAFAACTSPHTVKVKKGKHTFSVRAVDQAGNIGSPASADWKVKRRRR